MKRRNETKVTTDHEGLGEVITAIGIVMMITDALMLLAIMAMLIFS